MCRYGFHSYKLHYLCFNCRKQFKQLEPFQKMGRDLSDRYSHLASKAEGRYSVPKYHYKYDRNNRIIELTAEERVEYETLRTEYCGDILCPQCRQPMANVGRDIKAPKMVDKAAWKALQDSYVLGYNFGSCGCSGPGFVPRDKEQFKAFLEKRLAEYQAYADKCIKGEESHYDKFYWFERIDKISAALKNIK